MYVVLANANVSFLTFYCFDSYRQENKAMIEQSCQVTDVLEQGPTHTSVQWEQADKGLLLLYKAIPVLLDEIPDKQVTSEAARHRADDQGQLLGLDEVTLQAFI